MTSLIFANFPEDSINLSITVSDDVKSEDVKITMMIINAIDPNEVDPRGAVTRSLREVLSANWNLTTIFRKSNATGQEEIHAQAVARVAEEQLLGLSKKCQEASRPGLKITMGEIDYSPPKNKINDAKTALRKKIYALAKEELLAVKETEMDMRDLRYDWRIGSVNFTNFDNNPPTQTRASTAYLATASSAGGAEEFDLSHRVSLTANVVLNRSVNLNQ